MRWTTLLAIVTAVRIAYADREPCATGAAAYQANNLPRAYRELSQCDDDYARQLLVAVEARLGTGNYAFVELVVQPAHARTIGAFEEPLVGSNRFWLPFGTYHLTTQADGYVDRVTELVVTDHTPQSITLALDPIEQPAPKPPAPKPVPPPTLRPALITSMATIAFTASAVFFHVRGSEDSIDARAARGAAWTLTGIAGVAAIASGYLWYRVATHKVDIAVSPGGAIAIRARW